MNDIENALGQAGLDRQLRQPDRHGRVALGGLENKGIARGDGRREHPERDHRGKVERGDARADADWLAHGIHVDPRPGPVGELALEQMRRTGGKFGHFQTAQDIAPGIVHGLAVLGAEQFGQFLHVAIDQRHKVEEDAGPALRVGGSPLGLRGSGRGDCGIEISLGGQRDASLHLARRRVEHVLEFGAVAGGFDAVDEMADGAHNSLPCLIKGMALRFKHRNTIDFVSVVQILMFYRRDHSVDTLPLAVRDQGWGAGWPAYRGAQQPLPASPVKGEVPLHSWSKIGTESTAMNWDDVRIFLAVARSGQILGAARSLGLNHATVARRLTALEQALGSRLFTRKTNGSELSGEGERFLVHAERMESAMLAASESAGADSIIDGTVRVGAPDGFGVAFLAPRLGELTERHKGLRIELVPISRAFSLSRREADIAVTLERPREGRLVARKLTDYRLGLYAAQSYLSARCTPADLAALADHQLIGYVDDLIFTASLDYTAEFFKGWRSSLAISSAMG